MGQRGLVKIVRYGGRFATSRTVLDDAVLDDTVLDDTVLDDAVLDDRVPGTEVVAMAGNADLIEIDDPLSFPWELAEAVDALMVIDVGSCSPDQLAALRPALRNLPGLGEFDSVIHRATPDDYSSQRLAAQLGVRPSKPTTTTLPTLLEAKKLERAEHAILRRLRSERQTLVIDLVDVADTDWPSLRWTQPDDSREAAVVVRIPGDVIRSSDRGFGELGRSLVEHIGGTRAVGVWGVRAAPGEPLSHALLVVGVSS